jgi:hypothetical protein
MQFRLRTLLIVLAVGPVVLAGTWWAVGRDMWMIYQGVDLSSGVEFRSRWDLPYENDAPSATNSFE